MGWNKIKSADRGPERFVMIWHPRFKRSTLIDFRVLFFRSGVSDYDGGAIDYIKLVPKNSQLVGMLLSFYFKVFFLSRQLS